MKEIICHKDNLDAAAAEFMEAIIGNTIIAFYGHLGAGKTTFIKAICDRLGVEDNVCSPTFTIVNEYQSAAGEPVFHFDFYRIDSLKEAQDLGLEEYFYSGCLCLMEWPEKNATAAATFFMTERYTRMSFLFRRPRILWRSA